jgi:large subunit ribosomal protein L30
MAEETKKIKITLVKSTIGRPEKHKKVARALGIKKLNQTVEHYDTAIIRGMVNKINHLVTVE